MPVEGIGATENIQAADTAPGGAMGKDQFLELLVAQMQHQDPLDPVDSRDMVAQLAQFSSLEQMQNLNQQFDRFKQDQSLVQSLFLNGESLQLGLTDGTQVEGIVEGVKWKDGATIIQIGGKPFHAADIESISRIETPDAVEAPPSGN